MTNPVLEQAASITGQTEPGYDYVREIGKGGYGYVYLFSRISKHGQEYVAGKFVYRVPGSLGGAEPNDKSQTRSSRTAPVNKNTTPIVIAMADRSSVTPNAINPATAPNISIIETAIDASI